jgi:hypothetical protein
MKKILMISILLLSGAFIFNACDDEENDYNWNEYTPVFIGTINGPAEVAASGLADYPYNYEVSYYRGGSTFEWTVTTELGTGEVIVNTEDVLEAKGKKASIVFPQRSEEDIATITVVETTANGVSSEPYSIEVQLNPFCPYDMEPFAGDYTGTGEPYHAPVVSMETTDNLNELHVFGLAYFVPTFWGENWVEGDGSCYIEFSCGDVVTIKPQWIGDTDYPDSYGITGEGTVDVDNKVIDLVYEVYYGWDGSTGTSAYGPITTTLTLNGKMIETIKELKKINK